MTDKENQDEDSTIGIHYELPDGKIAFVFGITSKPPEIYYYCNDKEGEKRVSLKEFRGWKARRDLKDFPDQKDPLLPHIFDLLWDIKRLSQLQYELEQGHEDEGSIREEMIRHGIVLQ